MLWPMPSAMVKGLRIGISPNPLYGFSVLKGCVAHTVLSAQFRLKLVTANPV